MSKLFIRCGDNLMHRYLAWLLIVVIVTVGIKSDLVYAEEDNWNVEYTLGLGSEYVIGEKPDEYRVVAQFGQEVNFGMELAAGKSSSPNRFKKTFTITMPTVLYNYITEDGSSPIEWMAECGDTEITECGYLLEEAALAANTNATGSNATGSNAAGSNAAKSYASKSNAAAAGKNNDFEMYTFELQFVEELRNAENPQSIKFEDTDFAISFASPFLMAMEYCVTQDGNDCEITMIMPGVRLPESVLTEQPGSGSWNTEWFLLINGIEQDKEEGDVLIGIGDTVEFVFEIADAGPRPVNRFSDKFEITMPEELYNLVTDHGKVPIQWPKSVLNTDEGSEYNQLFAEPDITADDNGNLVITLKFAEFFRRGALKSGADIVEANCRFNFKSRSFAKIDIWY